MFLKMAIRAHISAVRRVIVLDGSTQRIEGIITLRDVFNLILS